MSEVVIPKPLQQLFIELTQEPRFDLALYLAARDLLRLRIEQVRAQKRSFEERYGMSFEDFRQAWESGKLADRHSYEVERDYWEWEAAVTDEARLEELQEKLE